MKKLVKTTLFASLGLFLFSCNSDDSTPIKMEKVYQLTSIEQNYYDENETTDEKHLLHVTYQLKYDADFKLKKILYEDTGYINKKVVREQSFEMQHTLDDKGRLQTFMIKKLPTLVEEYTYTYVDDLIQSTTFNFIQQGKAVTATFSHNENKQMVNNDSQEADSPGDNIRIDYTYNEKNQVNQFKVNRKANNSQTVQLTYDDKLSPFYNLPYDLTSLLLNFNHTFPYSYKFPNNITSLTEGKKVNEVEFTYNEANLPTKAIYYTGPKADNLVASDITYSYIVREVEAKAKK